MNICTVYSHITGFDHVVEVVRAAFPKGVIETSGQDGSQFLTMDLKGGLFSPSQKLKISYRQRKVLSHEFPLIDDSPLTQNLKGLYGFVGSLPARNEKVRELFLHKIPTLNTEFSIIQEKGDPRKLKGMISTLALDFDAILFVQPKTPISRAGGQHFLDKELRLLLDTDGNCEVDELVVQIKSVYFENQQENITPAQKERKERSEQVLASRNVRVNGHLPVVESDEETAIRSAREIAERACVLTMVNMFAFGNVKADDAIGYLRKYNLWELATPKERALLSDPSEEKRMRETWKYEDIYILLWALKIVDELNFPDQLVNMSGIDPANFPFSKDRDPNDFIRTFGVVREKSEILDANDLYYRMDWACVDARLNNREIEGVNPGVVYERHYALNWLVNYMSQDWDDVSCDT